MTLARAGLLILTHMTPVVPITVMTLRLTTLGLHTTQVRLRPTTLRPTKEIT